MRKLKIFLIIFLTISINIFSQNSTGSKGDISRFKKPHITATQDSNITLIGTWGSKLWDIDFSNDYAYVITRENGDLSIIDVSEPSNPTQIGFYYTGDKESNIFVLDNYAYTIGASGDWSTGYFRIIDISSRANPFEVGFYDLGEYANGIFVRDNYAYILLHHGGLKIIDISEPTASTEIGFCQAVDRGKEIFVEENFAFIVGGIGEWCSSAQLCIIDIFDLSNPVVTGTFDESVSGDNASYRDVFIVDHFAYVTFISFDCMEAYPGRSRLVIIDINNPSQPIEISQYDIWANDVYVLDEYAFIAAGKGVIILDINDHSTPQEVGYFNTGISRALSVSDNIIYTVGDNGLYILRNDLITDIMEEKSVPSSFKLKQNYPNPFNPVTAIKYQLPQTTIVDLSIYNLLGQKVATLVSEEQPLGNYKVEWDA
ncbi:LVIVD repeat-containing protein, partial [Bacteroidota bacterium]